MTAPSTAGSVRRMDFRGDDAGACASALAWWAEAGVDTLVEDTPRDWLAARARDAAPPAAPIPVADALPDTLDAFIAHRIADAAMPDPPGPRVAPFGSAASGLMILVDRPEPGEAALLEGPAGRLFDRMLAAIGRDRGSVYVAPLIYSWSAAAPSPQAQARLADLASAHVALVAPQRLLLMGDAVNRALLGMVTADARGRLHRFNHKVGSVAAIASYHPRSLLDRPAMKAAAWQDLLLLMGDIDQ